MNGFEVPILTREEERLLLRIARDAMLDCVTHGSQRDLESYPLTPALREKHGAFVTLRCAGHLRGSVGAAVSHDSLAENVQIFTIQAALHDEEFRPIAPNEVSDIDVEIAVVQQGANGGSPFCPVERIEDIAIGRDGLYLEHAGARGGALILPHLALQHQWDLAHYLKALCRKAGAPRHAWELPGAKLYCFHAQVFSERHHSDYPDW